MVAFCDPRDLDAGGTHRHSLGSHPSRFTNENQSGRGIMAARPSSTATGASHQLGMEVWGAAAAQAHLLRASGAWSHSLHRAKQTADFDLLANAMRFYWLSRVTMYSSGCVDRCRFVRGCAFAYRHRGVHPTRGPALHSEHHTPADELVACVQHAVVVDDEQLA
jgi:hypothetical protein